MGVEEEARSAAAVPRADGEAVGFSVQDEAAQMYRRAGVGIVLLAFVIALVVFCLVVGGCALAGYNKAVSLAETVDQRWAQVEVVLQRRYDLIPNLVETVKGCAAHETEIFTEIAESRERYFQASGREDKVAAANGLERALSRLLVLQERYPELKALASFLDLQIQLEGAENRIAVERQRYNEAVNDLNTFCRRFPGRWYARWAGVRLAEYLRPQPAATETPRVDFTEDKSP